MAQTINTFIKSKLNKDLDARLLPNGEYRDAYNVQVSKSEGPNVGSLENVLGNKEEIKTLWEKNGKEAALKGTRLHNDIEKFYNKILINSSGEEIFRLIKSSIT